LAAAGHRCAATAGQHRDVGDDAGSRRWGRAFVRALLPVSLSGGYAVTYGVWVAIHPGEFQRAFGVWWEPQHQDLRLEGVLANSIRPWGLLAAQVSLAVHDQQTPYCSGSPEAQLSRVLREERPHEDILGTLP
jgi:hypothetical protein